MLPAMHWSLALKVGSAAKNGTVIQSRTCIQRTLLLVCARAQPEPGDSAAAVDRRLLLDPRPSCGYNSPAPFAHTNVSCAASDFRELAEVHRRSRSPRLVARHQPTVGQHSICSCSACSCLWLRPCACTLRRPRRRASRLRKCSARPLSWPW